MSGSLDSLTDTLTDKERETLRLLLRGHDAKSSARALGLSVHTVNERLREARRKLGVTSSREAARLLLAEEGDTPEMRGDKPLGDAREGRDETGRTAPADQRRAGLHPALPLAGALAMSLILAALLAPASPLPLTPASQGTTAVSGESDAAVEVATRAAENFLVLIDQSRWAESYAATSAQFRKLNTLERWAEVSQQARPPLGRMLTRDLVGTEFIPAPPQGYRLVKFRSTYANGTTQTESISLAWEDGAWKVAGIMFD